ncbi:stage III sporulation protein AH [Ruminococcaceae bacterium FB2012]|nr:stage III sporulation protein AH [Ruminococcaceae bacterium FB2012]
MRKPSFIIGKKQIALAALTLMLGTAVYVNYAVSSDGKGIKTTDKVETKTVNYGDTQLVSAEPTEDYFAKARIERMTSRDKAIETLQTIMTGGDATEDEKTVAAKQAATVSGNIESESKIENLIKAAGFEDCVVYLDGQTANIVVKSPQGLIASEAAQIKDILLGEVEVSNENIRIYDVE